MFFVCCLFGCVCAGLVEFGRIYEGSGPSVGSDLRERRVTHCAIAEDRERERAREREREQQKGGRETKMATAAVAAEHSRINVRKREQIAASNTIRAQQNKS